MKGRSVIFGGVLEEGGPDCRSTNHSVAHLFSCPTHTTDLAGGICGRYSSRSLNSWQGSHNLATCLHCRSISTPSVHNLHSRCWPSPPWPPAGPHHPHLTLNLISPAVRRSSPPSANQQRCIADVILRNEGSMLQTCRFIKVHVVTRYMLRPT